VTLPIPLSGGDTEAKTKHKKGKRRKKPSPPPLQPQPQPAVNAFGCLDVGQPCQGDSALCCSGVCDGSAPAPDQPDTSVCVAHNAGICFADSDSCAGGGVPCNPNKPNCLCMKTTGNAGFCADFTNLSQFEDTCRLCSADTDCEAEWGPGAACIVFGGICTPLCPTTGRTACAPPCA
jgi:hypothetical protein